MYKGKSLSPNSDLKPSHQSNSFSNSRRKRHFKNSDLMNYIDCCLFQNKKNMPVLDKSFQKIFPLKLSKPIHTLNVPALFPNPNIVMRNLTGKEVKQKKPCFYILKKSYKAAKRKRIDVAKSLDYENLLNIKVIADKRPKSVMLKKKVSFVMQTDD